MVESGTTRWNGSPPVPVQTGRGRDDGRSRRASGLDPSTSWTNVGRRDPTGPVGPDQRCVPNRLDTFVDGNPRPTPRPILPPGRRKGIPILRFGRSRGATGVGTCASSPTTGPDAGYRGLGLVGAGGVGGEGRGGRPRRLDRLVFRSGTTESSPFPSGDGRVWIGHGAGETLGGSPGE